MPNLGTSIVSRFIFCAAYNLITASQPPTPNQRGYRAWIPQLRDRASGLGNITFLRGFVGLFSMLPSLKRNLILRQIRTHTFDILHSPLQTIMGFWVQVVFRRTQRCLHRAQCGCRPNLHICKLHFKQRRYVEKLYGSGKCCHPGSDNLIHPTRSSLLKNICPYDNLEE